MQIKTKEVEMTRLRNIYGNLHLNYLFNDIIETRENGGSDQMLVSLEHQAKTPLKLENYLRKCEFEINNLRETKRGVLLQKGMQNNAREEVYSKPEYNDTLTELIRLCKVEKLKVNKLS